MDGKAKVELLLQLKNGMKGGLDKAKSMVSADVQAMKDKLDGLKSKHIEAFSSMRDEIPGLGRAMDVLGNPYVMVTAGLVALTGVFSSAKAAAAEWDAGMAKVNVTAGLGKNELGALSDQVLAIGARNTGPLQEVPQAFNKIISAGLDVNTALATLEPTLKAAKAGFTDVETVAKAAVATMTSSGIMDANKVYDVLFATLNKGNAEFADIANYLPKIVPMAKAAGYSLEQVAGSFAFLTAQGMSSEQSSTGLTNLFKSLSDDKIISGSKNKLGLKGLGINVFDAAGEAKPLIDIIDQIKTKTQSLTAEGKTKFFDQIGFDMETSTTIASMTQNIDKLRDDINFTTNSAGQLNAAVDNSKVASESWNVAGNMIKATMIEIGQPINDSFGRLGEEIMPYLQTALETMKPLLMGIWDVLSAIGSIAWSIIKPFLDLGKIILDWMNKSQLLKDLWDGIKTVMGAVVDVIGWISDKISWLYEHTLKPVLDGISWVYDKFKSFSPDNMMTEMIQTQVSNGTIDVKGLNQDQLAELQKRGIDFGDKRTTGGAVYQSDLFGNPVKKAEGVNDYGFAIAPKVDLYGTKKESFTGAADKADKTKAPKSSNAGTSVNGKAEQVRNVTINVQTVGVNGDFVSTNADFSNMNKQQLEGFFGDILNRFVQNLETSYN
jgi:TP901 family phage tail tape measure protein